MSERTAHSPSEQSIFRGSWRERIMLNRISKLALRLPEEFDEKGSLGRSRVYGKATDSHATIKIEEDLSEGSDAVTRFTGITLDRSEDEPSLLTNLTADSYITDEVAELHGISGRHEVFALGDTSSDLSMYRVMRYMSLAVHTVEGAKTLEYLSRPDPERIYPQLF